MTECNVWADCVGCYQLAVTTLQMLPPCFVLGPDMVTMVLVRATIVACV